MAVKQAATELVPSLDLSSGLTPEAKELRLARMREIEDECLQRAIGNCNAIQCFSEVSRDEENPPESWVQELGLEAAQKKLAIAKEGWKPQKEAPFGAIQAMQIMIGIAKARGQSVRVGTLELNARISLPAPTTSEHPGPVVYEVRDISDE
jgi:hypothetical protein